MTKQDVNSEELQRRSRCTREQSTEMTEKRPDVIGENHFLLDMYHPLLHRCTQRQTMPRLQHNPSKVDWRLDCLCGSSKHKVSDITAISSNTMTTFATHLSTA